MGKPLTSVDGSEQKSITPKMQFTLFLRSFKGFSDLSFPSVVIPTWTHFLIVAFPLSVSLALSLLPYPIIIHPSKVLPVRFRLCFLEVSE